MLTELGMAGADIFNYEDCGTWFYHDGAAVCSCDAGELGTCY